MAKRTAPPRIGLLLLLISLGQFAATCPSMAVARWVVGGRGQTWSSVGTSIALDDTTRPGVLQPADMTGKNVAVGALARGGWIDVNHHNFKASIPLAIDGDPNTVFPSKDLDQRGGFPIVIIADLGVPFAVDSVSFYVPRGYEAYFLSGYEIFTDASDEPLVIPHISIGWYQLVENWELAAQDPLVSDTITIGVPIRQQIARHVALTDSIKTNILHWALGEFEVWGVGYPLRGEYVSNIIDLNQLTNLGDLHWSGGSDPESGTQIRTRVGRTPDPQVYNEMTGIGPTGQRRVTRSAYESLQPKLRGSIDPDRENWTAWCAPYDSSGSPLISAGPAQYVQFEIQFESRSPMARAWVDSLVIEYSPSLVAREVVGEISPAEVAPGALASFTYALKGTFNRTDPGFDGVRIATPHEATVSAVRVGGTPVALFTAEMQGGSLEVRFPGSRARLGSELVEVDFTTRVFVSGTRFAAQVFDTGTQDVPQQVVAGDAFAAGESNDTLVRLLLSGGSLLKGVEVSSAVLTPNGDGVNDRVEIAYSFLQVLSAVSVSFGIYDLAGNEVWRVEAVQSSGRHQLAWDGTRTGGGLVPPGTYVYRVVARPEKGDQVTTGVVNVVY